MKNIFMLLLFVFLCSCTVYTVTNKTGKELELKKAGGGTLTLRALKCVELNEYFLGLGGDFPFIIDGEGVEHGAGNYEIKPDSEKTWGYTTGLSEKNTDCEPEGESGSSDSGNEAPVCNDGKKATCHASTSKCVGAGETKNPACVGEDDKTLGSVTPECADKSKPSCPTQDGLIVDLERQVFCAKGAANCADGEVKCVKENAVITPVCLKEGKKVENVSVTCPNSGVDPKCLKSIRVTVDDGFSVSCTNNAPPSCADQGKAVCGKVSTDEENKPYCVNDQNVRWLGVVSCTDGSTPICQTAI